MARATFGSIHGRFQPFHMGHLQYAKAALERCEFLWIGIVQPFANETTCAVDPHRTTAMANPLNFYERVSLISASLISEGFTRAQFGFLPFPIDQPAVLNQCIGKEVICYTTVYDDWNRYKVQVLEQLGFTVEVLWEREQKVICGEDIRQSLLLGNDTWKELVPQSTWDIIASLDIPGRLRATIR